MMFPSYDCMRCDCFASCGSDMTIIDERLEDLREEFEKIKKHQIMEKKSLASRENGEYTNIRYAVPPVMITFWGELGRNWLMFFTWVSHPNDHPQIAGGFHLPLRGFCTKP